MPTTLRGRVDVEGPYVWVKSGTYTHNIRRHTNGYVAERAYSYNNREAGDLDRVRLVAAGANGRRITYRKLTDKLAG